MKIDKNSLPKTKANIEKDLSFDTNGLEIFIFEFESPRISCYYATFDNSLYTLSEKNLLEIELLKHYDINCSFKFMTKEEFEELKVSCKKQEYKKNKSKP